MKHLSSTLRARWAPHIELPTLFLYLEPLQNGAWVPERVGLGEVLIWEKDIAIHLLPFPRIFEEADAVVMEGEVDGLWSARLELRLQDAETGRIQIRRRFTRLGEAVEMAIEQSAIIDNGGWWPGNHLVLPSFSYDGNPGAPNAPHPEPIPGFSVRADRLAQPMVFYQDAAFSYGLAALEEHPNFPERPGPPPSRVYSFGVRPSASPLRLAIRYPHEEYGHEGTGPGDVLRRKGEYGPPVVQFTRLESGESFQDEIYLWLFPQREGLRDCAELTRFVWATNLSTQSAKQHDSLERALPDAPAESPPPAATALETALEACRKTGDAARIAADELLTCIFAYRIDTFEPESTAAKREISTFGATAVSTEKQCLGAFATPALIELGLLLNDPIYTQAGIQSLWWALDGRWALPAADGETGQFLQTDWFENENLRARGEFGGAISPAAARAFAKVGGALVYADLERGVGIDGCEVESVSRSDSGLSVVLRETLGKGHEIRLVVRNLPPGRYAVGDREVDAEALQAGLPVPIAAEETITVTLE